MAGGVVAEVGIPFVAVGRVVSTFRSRVEKSAAVAAAPVSADTLAIMAMVVLDIVHELYGFVSTLECADCTGKGTYSYTAVAVTGPPSWSGVHSACSIFSLVTRWLPEPMDHSSTGAKENVVGKLLRSGQLH